VKICSALQERLDRFDQQSTRVGFQDVAARAGVHEILGQIFGLVDGEDQNLRGRHHRADLPRGFEAVQLRHADVENDDVGPEFLRLRDGFASGRCVGAEVPALVPFEQRVDPWRTMSWSSAMRI